MLNFQAVLINSKFDIDCRNVLRFDTREAQENYFNCASLFSNAKYINFNSGSLIETTIVYQISENESINDLLSKNYCIVKDNSPNANLKYYYFFVKNSMQDSANQIKVWLELDVFQTYYIDLNFSDCEILRAHLNRFNDDGDGTVSFRGGIDSDLFEREPIQNVSKRLTKRTKINFQNDVDADINEWLNENVVAWAYIFVDYQHEYEGYGYTTTSQVSQSVNPINYLNAGDNQIDFEGDSYINTKMACLAYPIMKTDASIKLQIKIAGTKYEKVIDRKAFTTFLKLNNDFSYVYQYKISKVSPFANKLVASYPSTLKIDSNGDLIISDSDNTLAAFGLYRLFTAATGALLGIHYQKAQQRTTDYSLNFFKFNKTDIVGAVKNLNFNPKLLNSDYKELKIVDENEGGGNYDIQKINQNSIAITYVEPLNADITRMYAYVNNFENGIYNENLKYTFFGMLENEDTSLPMSTSQFQEMLANTKNFYVQNKINRITNLTTASVSAGLNLASGNYGATATGVASGLTDLFLSKTKENLNVDNMRSAPADVANIGGLVLMPAAISDFGIFVEEYDALENEKRIANDFMDLNGFTYGKIGNIKNFDNIRKFHNFIQANIQETSGINISRNVHEKFKQLFFRGVRFWNTDDFDYSKENYEIWLEN